MTIVDSTKWHKALNWKNQPNFQTCHRHPKVKDFFDEYYLDEEINNLITNVIHLISPKGSSNAKITGKMGSGKTTFLHYLRRIIAEEENLSKKIHFSIIRAGRIDTKDHEESLRELAISKVFKIFFKISGYKDIFDRINEQPIRNQSKINKLFEYYLDPENIFEKTLIIILDDMDTIKIEEDVRNITVAFKKLCGSGDGISKWVALRETTYERYSEETLSEFTFFQQPFILPQVSLYEIVRKRILSNNNENAINPFSESLCNKILKLKKGSIRDSLGILSMILHYTNPPTAKQSEEVIQNWFEKSSITTLLKQNEVPNVHTEKYVTIFNYPVAYDLLHIIRYSHIRSHIFSIADYVAKYYRGSDFKGNFSILENQLDAVLKMLEANNLVLVEQGIIRLSFKGKLVVTVSQKHYNVTCKKLTIEDLQDIDSQYWDTLHKEIDYKRHVEDKNLYRTN